MRYLVLMIAIRAVLCCFLACFGDASVWAQSNKLPKRAKPPQFEQADLAGVFFKDLDTVLSGDSTKLPWNEERWLSSQQEAKELSANQNDDNRLSLSDSAPSDSVADWRKLISSSSLEDLIKEAKQRVDRSITTPSAFAGGGFQEARKEFSLLSLLFAIIEKYPDDVRWKLDAATARLTMNRVAANTKVGSRQVFDEAKKRKSDLESLLSGVSLPAEPASEIVWENLIDLGPLMQLLGMAYEQRVSQNAANDSQFARNPDDLRRYSELIAVLSTAATFEGMPYSDDDQFRGYARELTQLAREMVEAVDGKDPQGARRISGQIGQSCQRCHESFR